MKRAYILLLSAALSIDASASSAQERDAQVLRPGEIRLTAGAEYHHVDSRFGEDGTEGIAGDMEGPLTAATFVTLGSIVSDFFEFMDETQGVPGASAVNPATLTAGTLSVDAAASTRVIPFRLAAGVFRRLEIGVELPVYREERIFRRFANEGANVGINPEPEANAELLAEHSEVGAALAGAALLPVSGTALATELQRRVLALTGSELVLPETAVVGPELRSVSTVFPGPRSLSLWQPGDLRIDARIELLRSFADTPFPPLGSGETHHRVTAFVAARLPTGREARADAGIDARPNVGFTGGQAGAVADLFLGERFWISGGGSYAKVATSEVDLLVPPTGGIFTGPPEIRTVRRSPGDAYELWIVPRVRLSPAVSLGMELRSEGWLQGTYELRDLRFPVAAASRHSAGFSVRYTTLPVSPDGGYEIAVGYTGAFAGSGSADAASVAFFQVSLRQRVLGRD